MTIRRAAVAGRFYEADPVRLLEDVEGMLGTPAPDDANVAAVVPHAGHVYSGGIAGATFSRLPRPNRIVILAVNHYGAGEPVASWASGSWETPLGLVPVDAEMVARIARYAPFVRDDPRAHLREHSLEVELPFVQVLWPGTPIAPLSIGTRDPSTLEDLGRAVACAVRETEGRVLIVASTDFTHYEPAVVARAQDQLAIEQIHALDGLGLLRCVREQKISMCGAAPTAALLVAVRELGASGAALAGYATSGDVTGDQERVVGYGGLVVH